MDVSRVGDERRGLRHATRDPRRSSGYTGRLERSGNPGIDFRIRTISALPRTHRDFQSSHKPKDATLETAMPPALPALHPPSPHPCRSHVPLMGVCPNLRNAPCYYRHRLLQMVQYSLITSSTSTSTSTTTTTAAAAAAAADAAAAAAAGTTTTPNATATAAAASAAVSAPAHENNSPS